MTHEFVIWLQGVRDAIGDRTPTECEWKLINERVDAEIGKIVRARIKDSELESLKDYLLSNPVAPTPAYPQPCPTWVTSGTGGYVRPTTTGTCKTEA